MNKIEEISNLYTICEKQLETSDNGVISFTNLEFNFEFDIDYLLKYLKRTCHYDKLEKLSFQNCVFRQKLTLTTNGKNTMDYAFSFDDTHFFDEVILSDIELTQDVDFIKCIFEKDVFFTESIFRRYLKLNKSIFKSDVNFDHSLFEKSIVLSRTINDRVQFKGNVDFSGATLNDARFWDLVFEKDVKLYNTRFNSHLFFNRTKIEGKISFGSVDVFGEAKYKGNIYFDQAVINEISIDNLFVDTSFRLNEAKISNIKIDNSIFSKTPLSLSGVTIRNVQDEQTARILKNEAIKSSNHVLAIEMRAKEHNLLRKRLPWKNAKDKIILSLNHCSNDHGTNWFKGVLFTIISWLLFFSIFVLIRDGYSFSWNDNFVFIFTSPLFWQEAINFLWLPEGLKGLIDDNSIFSENIAWWRMLAGAFFFLAGKIAIAYGMFQTVSAFRKYVRS